MVSSEVRKDMATAGKYFTRFTIFLWGGIGLLVVALRHILADGYNNRAGFMLLLGVALFAAAFTDRQKRKLQAWRDAEMRKALEKEREKRPPK